MIEVKIPSPGESISEVELTSWFVADGDMVEKDQEIAEIESDKASLNLVAEASGKIEITTEEGSTVDVGTVIAKIDDSVAPEENKEKDQDEDEKEDKNKSSEEKDDKKDPSKKGDQDDKTSKDEKDTTKDSNENKKEEKDSDGDADSEKVKTTPLAQKLMDEENISIDEILKGLKKITTREVNAYRKLKDSGVDKESDSGEAVRSEQRKKMSQLRRKISQRLVSVKNETAMLTTFNEVDMSKVMELRGKFQNKFIKKHEVKLGFMSFFTKAVTMALKDHPSVNSYLDGEENVTPEYSDIGIAVQAPKGLMVPVMRNAESMSLAEIEKEIIRLADKARNGKLSIEEMTGGTFTITNGGIFGSMLSTPIINPPQSGILGMHNIVDRPVALDGNVVIRPVMFVALSYDHRIIDGKDSVGFLVKIKQYIEDPVKMLVTGDPESKLLEL